jgi:hypothetical protein
VTTPVVHINLYVYIREANNRRGLTPKTTT